MNLVWKLRGCLAVAKWFGAEWLRDFYNIYNCLVIIENEKMVKGGPGYKMIRVLEPLRGILIFCQTRFTS